MKYYITKSRSGHYTVTGKSGKANGNVSVTKLPSLLAAREVVKTLQAGKANKP